MLTIIILFTWNIFNYAEEIVFRDLTKNIMRFLKELRMTEDACYTPDNFSLCKLGTCIEQLTSLMSKKHRTFCTVSACCSVRSHIIKTALWTSQSDNLVGGNASNKTKLSTSMTICLYLSLHKVCTIIKTLVALN